MKRKLWPVLLTLALIGGCDNAPEPEASTDVNPVAGQEAHTHETTQKPPHHLVGDIAEGKVLAERCARCHGINGVLARSGSPFLAGLTQEYQLRSLIAYREGTRKHAAMLDAIQDLTPKQLADVSAWYASLDTQWHGAVATQKSRAVLTDDKAHAAAERLLPGCKSCHNRAAIFKQDQAIPALAGMPTEYFVPALKAYFDNHRHNDIMALFENTLNDNAIYNLAAWYAAQRPEPAPMPTQGNPANGKVLARDCAGCHGYDGNSLNPYVPNLAGLTADYLRKALKHYRDGQRTETLMTQPAQYLTDSDIADLSAYYALQYPESQLHKEIDSAEAFNPLPDGKRIAASCDSCHDGSKYENPILSGQSVQYLVAATRAYQEGTRKHGPMKQMVSFLSDIDIEKVAYHYAMQAPIKAKPTGFSQNGEALSSACTSCHGKNGVSDNPGATPSLAGQSAEYIIRATRAYGSGGRNNDSMKNASNDISDADLEQIAHWFAAQEPQAVKTWLPEDPAILVEKKCSRCHGERGYSNDAGIPRLAGQSEPYIIVTMREYQDGTRKDKKMEAMAYGLSLIEIKAIAAYYARQ